MRDPFEGTASCMSLAAWSPATGRPDDTQSSPERQTMEHEGASRTSLLDHRRALPDLSLPATHPNDARQRMGGYFETGDINHFFENMFNPRNPAK